MVPAIPVGGGQYEGFGYLGLGVLGCAAVALALRPWREARPTGAGPLVWVCVLMAVFAFSHRVQFAGWTVISYQTLFRRVAEPLAYVYRSSGRFIWPLHYLCIAGAVAGGEKPALLVVSIGPVQEFIAAARTTSEGVVSTRQLGQSLRTRRWLMMPSTELATT